MISQMHDPTFHLLLICASILVIKMWAIGAVTGFLRNFRHVHISPEDYRFLGREPAPPNEQIERIRRAHRNDLESILPFLAIAFLATITGSISYSLAWWLFVPYTVARVLHTIFYAFGLQPWRSIVFGIADMELLITSSLVLANALR